MIEPVIIYTDGSCNNKKSGEGARVGGAGVVMSYKGMRKEIAQGCYHNTTSARMEIMAMIVALENINVTKKKYDIILHTDNQYCSNTINKGWYDNWVSTGTLMERSNCDLWIRFFKLYDKLGGRKHITLKWIKGHNGHPENEKADELANQGRSKENVLEDHKEYVK